MREYSTDAQRVSTKDKVRLTSCEVLTYCPNDEEFLLEEYGCNLNETYEFND